jgi:hypothetical protein
MTDGAHEAERVELVRPRVRADCEHAVRPCPWAGCRWHLLNVRHSDGRLEVGGLVLEAEADGATVDVFTEAAAEAVVNLPESCALDLADQDGMSQHEVGAVLGVSGARVGQLEQKLVPILRRRARAHGIG